MLSLTATQLPRYIQCNGYAELDSIQEQVSDTTLRDEGVAAHWLIEQVFSGKFSAEELVDRKAENGVYITGEMIEQCQEYLETVGNTGWIEIDTSYSDKGWEIRGRADHIAVSDNTLFIDDFKFGWRIVEPEENWTLISHAVGYLSNNGDVLNNVNQVVFRIFQPRPVHPKGSVRTWSVSLNDLTQNYWAKIKQCLENTEKTLNSGANCYKCKSRTNCPAAQISAMNAIDVSQKVFNSHLEGDDLTYVYRELKKAHDVIKQNIDAYTELIVEKVKQGEKVPGYSIGTSFGPPEWRENITPELMKVMTGRDDLVKEKLITPSQAKKKGVPEEIIKGMSERKSKGVKLVQVDEKENAQNLFGLKN